MQHTLLHRVVPVFMLAMMVLMTGASVLHDDDKDKEEEEDSALWWSLRGSLGVGYPAYDNLAERVTTSPGFVWMAGAFLQLSTQGVVSVAFQPELLFVRETGLQAGFNVAQQNVVIEATTVVNSIRLPALLKLQFLEPKIVGLSVFAGPTPGYILRAYTQYESYSPAGGPRRTSGIQVDKDLLLGLTVGIDVTLLDVLMVDVRVNTPFTPVSYDLPETANNKNLRAPSTVASAGVTF